MTSIEQTCAQLHSEFDVIGEVDCSKYATRWHDLFLAFYALYRECYDPDQRIIVKLTGDYYNTALHGMVLQSLQCIINEIDISNFFICLVSTNPDLESEYKTVLDCYSIDSVPFHLYSCSGKFEKKIANDCAPLSKIQSLKSNAAELADISDAHKQLLLEKENFCIVPWISMMIDTNNKVRPCCEFDGTVGDASNNSLEQIWNKQPLKHMRVSMLNNQPVTGCERCIYKEKVGRDSLRTALNRRFISHINKVERTHSDGHLDCFDLVYVDSRFNNLCNLSCRSCSPYASSSWHKPAVELGIIAKDTPIFLSAGRHKGDLVDQILEHKDTIERIYFAGGEPLIIEDFYTVLYELEAHNRTDVELIYNTNLTKMQIKKHNIFDAWKNFNHISIGASLDAEGNRGEYLRSGTHWDDVVACRKMILEKRPDIDFSVSATTGLINALHVPDFHRSWVEQQLITPEQFNIQMLFSPNYMRVDTAPVQLKQKIQDKYKQHLEWLRPMDKLGRATFGFESILKQLENNIEFDRELFWKHVNPLDAYYNTDLLDTFPELEEYL